MSSTVNLRPPADVQLRVIAGVDILYGAILVTFSERFTAPGFGVAFRQAGPLWWGWLFILAGVVALVGMHWFTAALTVGVIHGWAFCLVWATVVTRESSSPGSWVPWVGLGVLGVLAIKSRGRVHAAYRKRGPTRGVD